MLRKKKTQQAKTSKPPRTFTETGTGDVYVMVDSIAIAEQHELIKLDHKHPVTELAELANNVLDKLEYSRMSMYSHGDLYKDERKRIKELEKEIKGLL